MLFRRLLFVYCWFFIAVALISLYWRTGLSYFLEYLEINRTHRELPFNEFIAMMALMMSIAALSIDAMLPALDIVGNAFGVSDANDNQAIIGWLFFGMAFGQLLFGPLSDSIGRRGAMFSGFSVFLAGSVLAVFAHDFTTLLLGRFLQGIGAAAPRVLTTAIVRDLYSGRAMARVMSFILMFFILVPMLAPMLGQLILLVLNWQAIFVIIALLALASLLWYMVRQGETLNPEDQVEFTFRGTAQALRTIFNDRSAIGYSLAAGLVFGPFIFYLSSSQQLFQKTYGLGQWFPLYFAGLSFIFGLSSFFNGKQVLEFGMHRIVRFALICLSTSSVIFLIVLYLFDGLPMLWISTVYMLVIFFCIALLFGNLNALAMESLGHIAGIGAAVVGFVSILLASTIAMITRQFYDSTMYPLVISFAMAGVLTLALMRWIGKD